jgi:molybdopterin converting factor small subunit
MRVLFFHTLREFAGQDEITLQPVEPLTPTALWHLLELRMPGISQFAATTRLACNHHYITPGTVLHSEDEVALIPPVSGG